MLIISIVTYYIVTQPTLIKEPMLKMREEFDNIPYKNAIIIVGIT